MSETSSPAQRSAGAAGSEKAERLCLIFVAGGIVIALALAVVMLRLHRLNEIPLGIFFDEAAHGVDALRVLQGEHAVFFPENYGREGLIVYAVALGISFLGRTVMAVRLPTALASAGAVFVVFWLGRVLFGREERFDSPPRRGATEQATPWRGLLVGGVGAGLLAVSIGQTILGRTAFRANFLPLLLSLCLALLWRGWQQRSWPRVALAGACAGLLPYTYTAARFTPFLFLFFGLSFLLPLRAITRARVRAELPRVGVFLGVAGLVAAPILVHFALHPHHFFIRSNQIWVFDSSRSQGDPLVAFLVNVWEHLLKLGFFGDLHWYHIFVGKPMLTTWEAFFLWLGVGMVLWRWQRPAYRLLLLWLGVLLLPAILSLDAGSPSIRRMIGLVPAVYLLVAVGMWEAFRFLKERCRAHLYFRENETKAAIAVGVVVGGLIVPQGVDTYRSYFQRWANSPHLYEEYDTEWTDLARALNEQPSHADIVYLVPSFFAHPSFEYQYQGATPVNILKMSKPDLVQKIESMLAAMENVSQVKVVEWNTKNSWIEDNTEPFDFLLRKYGRYLGSDEYARFRVHNYVDISLARPWTYYESLDAPTVHYDGGIALQGLALGQGEEQLSTRQPLPLVRDRSLWGVLQWQTSPELDVDYAISLRLYNTAGERAYQADDVLWKPTNHSPTSQWSADELVESLFHLDLPGDLLSGEYELRMVVYDFETQVPTVQVGVWEPEVALARLRLAEVR